MLKQALTLTLIALLPLPALAQTATQSYSAQLTQENPDTAQSSLPSRDTEQGCGQYPDIPVRVAQRFDPPTYNLSANLATIQQLSRDPQHAIPENHGGLTLGLTHYEPMLQLEVPMRGMKFSNGLKCAHADHVDLTIGYREVIVYIPREVPQGTCGFNEVLAHEQKHVNVNRQLLVDFTPYITQRVQEFIRQNGNAGQQDMDTASANLNAKLRALLAEVGQQMFDENTRRQRLVDSPEEYRRISLSCNGQLTQTANQFYRANH